MKTNTIGVYKKPGQIGSFRSCRIGAREGHFARAEAPSLRAAMIGCRSALWARRAARAPISGRALPGAEALWERARWDSLARRQPWPPRLRAPTRGPRRPWGAFCTCTHAAHIWSPHTHHGRRRSSCRRGSPHGSARGRGINPLWPSFGEGETRGRAFNSIREEYILANTAGCVCVCF